MLPVATVLTTFGVYSMLGNTLTPQLTFTALALLDEIRGPILSVGEVTGSAPLCPICTFCY